MYVRVQGQLYIAPVGSEYLGLGSDNIPVVFSPKGEVARMMRMPVTSTITAQEDE